MSDQHNGVGAETTAPVGAHTPSAHGPSHAHPPASEYVKIGVYLAILTAIEVALFYVEGIVGPIVVPMLLALAIAKFVLVILWFMHLKFDSPLYSGVFIGPLIIILMITLILMALFGQFGPAELRAAAPIGRP